MSLLQALVLGIVQGVTEYIPVSSSAHLMLVPWLIGWPDPAFSFEVLVQWGTLVGVFVYFWHDLCRIVVGVIGGILKGRLFEGKDARLGWMVVLGTIPAVIVGFLLKEPIEAAFGKPMVAAAMLFVTAVLLLAAEHFGGKTRDLDHLGPMDAVVVGVFQAMALLPGVSRSGATISGGILKGFDRVSAARFSFLLSVPAMLGAGVMELLDLVRQGALMADLPVLGIGAIAAAVSGYLCIRWLLAFVKGHRLTVFAAYCAAFGILCLVIGFVRG